MINIRIILSTIATSIAFPVILYTSFIVMYHCGIKIEQLICDVGGSHEIYDKYMYKLPVAEVVCSLNKYNSTTISYMIGILLLMLSILSIIIRFTFQTIYLCLIYHFGQSTETRSGRWYECMYIGHYTLKTVWHDNIIQSTIISIPTCIIYAVSKAINDDSYIYEIAYMAVQYLTPFLVIGITEIGTYYIRRNKVTLYTQQIL